MKAILIILASLGLASDNLYFITGVAILFLILINKELKKYDTTN